MAPSLSAQPVASSSNILFDWEAVHPAATEPQHTTAMPQASIPTLDENDTGLNWNDGECVFPNDYCIIAFTTSRSFVSTHCSRASRI